MAVIMLTIANRNQHVKVIMFLGGVGGNISVNSKT